MDWVVCVGRVGYGCWFGLFLVWVGEDSYLVGGLGRLGRFGFCVHNTSSLSLVLVSLPNHIITHFQEILEKNSQAYIYFLSLKKTKISCILKI